MFDFFWCIKSLHTRRGFIAQRELRRAFSCMKMLQMNILQGKVREERVPVLEFSLKLAGNPAKKTTLHLAYNLEAADILLVVGFPVDLRVGGV